MTDTHTAAPIPDQLMEIDVRSGTEVGSNGRNEPREELHDSAGTVTRRAASLSQRWSDPTDMELDRREITRLMLQELEDLGYHRTAQALEREAGILARSPDVRRLKTLLLSGEWEQAAELLPGLVGRTTYQKEQAAAETPEEALSPEASRLVDEARFLIYTQKLYEILLELLGQVEEGDEAAPARVLRCQRLEALQQAAVDCLCRELSPNAVAQQEAWRLHRLTIAVLRVSHARGSLSKAIRESLRSVLQGEGVPETTKTVPLGATDGVELRRCMREQLFHKLQPYIRKEKTIEKWRLETLLRRALRENLQQACFPYTYQERPSLLEDLVFQPMAIPSETWRILKAHRDEVWLVQFSHSGRWLLSAGKDGLIVVWDVARLSQSNEQIVEHRADLAAADVRALSNGVEPATDDASSANGSDAFEHAGCLVLDGHSDAICAVSWSPDDEMILSAAGDHVLRLWETRTGRCRFASERQTQAITACAWLHDGERFVTSLTDSNLYVWRVDGLRERTTLGMDRVRAHVVLAFHGRIFNDIAVNYFYNEIVGICTARCICRYDADGATALGPCIEESENMTALCVSRLKSIPVVLVSTSGDGCPRPEIHEWDFEHNALVQRYIGHQQGRFVIRSCFGGFRECFVLSGSEDAHVYIWKRRSGQLCARLAGHTGTVNAVAWSPTDLALFASASDDGTVRLWSTANRCM